VPAGHRHGPGNSRSRRIAGLALVAVLAACAEQQRETRPLFYASLESSSARIDAPTAASMLAGHRANSGLRPLVFDQALQDAAQAEANAMAAADRPASADPLKTRLSAAGVAGPQANLSAGYRTLAEAFSGWREQPQNNRVMLDPAATRFGLATAYAPGSKYKVYWALIVAGEEKP